MGRRPLSNVLIGVALICASILVSGLSYLQLHSTETDAAAPISSSLDATPTDLVSVVAARKAITRGQRLTAEFLSEIRVESPPAGAMLQSEAVLDAVALNDIPKGQIVTESALLLDEGARPGLSILVPDGLRAVALRVDDEISVGQFIRPNDRVDIHLVLPNDRVARVRGEDIRRADHTESSVLLQNVLILSTGPTLASADGKKAAHMKQITVAVSPDDALLLAIAKDAGRFYLALRNPTDEEAVVENRKHVDDLLEPLSVPEDLAPTITSIEPAAAKPRPRGWSTTIYRGGNSTVKKFTSDGSS